MIDIKTSDVFSLFDSIKCDNFPYKKSNGDIIWNYVKYLDNYKFHKYFNSWIYYYDLIVYLERLVINYKEICFYNSTINDYLRRISVHREKFIRKIYKLGVIDLKTYKLFIQMKREKYPLLYDELKELNLFEECPKMINSNSIRVKFLKNTLAL